MKTAVKAEKGETDRAAAASSSPNERGARHGPINALGREEEKIPSISSSSLARGQRLDYFILRQV